MRIDIDKNEFNRLVSEGYTIKDLAKHFNCSRWKIYDFRIKNNITHNFRQNFPIILTETQLSVLYGALLGDGCLAKIKLGNSNLVYCSSYEEHCFFVGNYFKDQLYDSCKDKPSKIEVFDKRTNKIY